MAAEKTSAQTYMIDPLYAPDPSDETGLGARLVTSGAPAPVKSQGTGSSLASNNPFRSSQDQKSVTSSHTRKASSGSHDSARKAAHSDSSPSYRQAAVRSVNEGSPRRSADESRKALASVGRPRRSSSLKERFPGDTSTHPLDTLTKEYKAASRSPHLRKKHLPGKDSIDQLDAVLGGYHHEGPYDAALLARNTSYTSSPVAALQTTTTETLRATPRDKITDSVKHHRPLDGVAVYPPGTTDPLGQKYEYQEGTDMMRDGDYNDGAPYKRYPGIEYDDDDLKGKGRSAEPEGLTLKEWNARRKAKKEVARHGEAVELMASPDHNITASNAKGVAEREEEVDGTANTSSSSHHRNWSGDLKRRMGSLKLK